LDPGRFAAVATIENRVSRHPRRPVWESLALDRFLVGDGLDAVTIASRFIRSRCCCR
jgi:hypothetical protein